MGIQLTRTRIVQRTSFLRPVYGQYLGYSTLFHHYLLGRYLVLCKDQRGKSGTIETFTLHTKPLEHEAEPEEMLIRQIRKSQVSGVCHQRQRRKEKSGQDIAH